MNSSGRHARSRQRGERDVVGDRAVHQQPLLAAVLGDEGHAAADALRAASGRRSACRRRRCSPRVVPVEAEEDARELGAARAHQAEEAEDLAAVQAEARYP